MIKLAIDWICLISICILVGEIMLYICKDVMLEYKKSIRRTRRKVVKKPVDMYPYQYGEKIAK